MRPPFGQGWRLPHAARHRNRRKAGRQALPGAARRADSATHLRPHEPSWAKSHPWPLAARGRHLQREAQVGGRGAAVREQLARGRLHKRQDAREGHIHALDHVGQLDVLRALLGQLLDVVACARAQQPRWRLGVTGRAAAALSQVVSLARPDALHATGGAQGSQPRVETCLAHCTCDCQQQGTCALSLLQ